MSIWLLVNREIGDKRIPHFLTYPMSLTELILLLLGNW